MATVVYTKPSQDGTVGTLFAGYAFWVSANVPQRNRFKELIQINGGTIVLLEKDADIKLVDHAKRDIPLNSHSYTFVEKSVRNGRLEDLEDHRAGQRTRPVGAVGIPARSSRTPFTLQDDQILWDWVQPYEKRGDQIAGNLIYQQLAEQNPRHTFQSWRDRYLKRLRHHGHRPGGPAQDDTAGPEKVSNVPRPKSTTTHAPNPDSQSGSSNIKLDSRATQDTAAVSKRKRPSYEETAAVSESGRDHASQKRRRIPRDDPVESDTQQETSDESQSLKYETAPQFPIPEESRIDDDDTLVPLTTHKVEDEENGNIDAWIQKRVESGRKLDNIVQALSCTSMDVELADKVLDLLSKGEKIPNNMRGVWTDEDDEALTGQDGRAMERVMNKHGSELFDERWQFLEQSARATQLVAEGGK